MQNERVREERVQRTRLAIGLALALLLHGAVVSCGLAELFELEGSARHTQEELRRHIDAEIQVAQEPEPKPAPEPELVPEALPRRAAAKKPTPQAPAPEAAQSGRVLTADPKPEEPSHLANTFVQGNADRYAGGVTAPSGTATHAVRAPSARADGIRGGTGTGPAGSDRSRSAGLADLTWATCPFPPQALGINLAQVRIMVTVSARGKPLEVQVLSNPGHGFAREAQRCAQRKEYLPALDRNGRPLTSTITILVTFQRH